MKIEYTRYSDTYDPISVAWEHDGKKVEIDFGHEITAEYSEKLSNIVVEDYKNKKLKFFDVNGDFKFDLEIPALAEYEFRGINKHNDSKTGLSLLFYPSGPDVGNKWRDIEQFEVDPDKKGMLGKKLGIFR